MARRLLKLLPDYLQAFVYMVAYYRAKGDINSIIIASSDKAYGKTKNLPYTEESILKGDHPYDFSKTGDNTISSEPS